MRLIRCLWAIHDGEAGVRACVNANTLEPFSEGREPLKRAASTNDLCVCKKNKKTFYFSSENQRGYLTDFPFVLLIVLLKPKKPKIFFLLCFSFVLFSAACAQLHASASACRQDFSPPSFPFIYHLFTSEMHSLGGAGQVTDPRTAAVLQLHSILTRSIHRSAARKKKKTCFLVSEQRGGLKVTTWMTCW